MMLTSYILDENFMTMDVFSKRTWLRNICNGWKEAGLVPKKKRTVHGMEFIGQEQAMQHFVTLKF